MAGTAADQVVMLLSADWFAAHWRAMELRVSADYQAALQNECRHEVERLLGEASTYWQVSFAPDRVRGTRTMLSSALGRYAPGSDFNKAVNNLLQYDLEIHDVVFHPAAALHMLNIELLDQGVTRTGWRSLSPEIIAKLRAIADEIGPARVECDQSAVDSRTDWDMRLRSVTPELQNHLVGFLSDEISTRLEALRFLRRVRTNLSPPETWALLDWYSGAAPKIVKQDFAMPSWMTEIVGTGRRYG